MAETSHDVSSAVSNKEWNARASRFLFRAIEKDELRDHTLARAIGTRWDERVDACRVLQAVNSKVGVAVTGSTSHTSESSSSSGVFALLPPDVLHAGVLDRLAPTDLFALFRSSRRWASLVRDFANERQKLGKFGISDPAQCAAFVSELDAALCLARYFRSGQMHRFRTDACVDACLSTIASHHVSGGRRPRLRVRLRTELDDGLDDGLDDNSNEEFDGNAVISPSGRVLLSRFLQSLVVLIVPTEPTEPTKPTKPTEQTERSKSSEFGVAAQVFCGGKFLLDRIPFRWENGTLCANVVSNNNMRRLAVEVSPAQPPALS